MPSARARPSAGFTMLEFVVVLAITGILIVGLGAVVEIPSRIAEQEIAGDARISDVDRAVRWLDDDVRFAKDVATPSVSELHVTRSDGQVVRYTWGGASGPLVRSAPEGTAELIGSTARVTFGLGMSEVEVEGDAGTAVETDVEAAGFDSFTLEPGYGLADLLPIGSPLAPVDLLVQPKPVKLLNKVGVVFTATGLEDDDGFVESVRLRLRRIGSGGLLVNVCEAFGSPPQPNWLKFVTGTHVENAALPGVMSDFTIPFPADGRLEQGKTYFLELAAPPLQTSVEVEGLGLSVPDAAAPNGGGFVFSPLGGGLTYAPLGGQLEASQTVFSVRVRKTATESVGSGGNTIEIPTCVQATIQIVTGEGVQSIDTSVPIVNNLARVNR
ncbi:MAG: type II secretion system protein J [Planctomycetota bacterium JB042]